MTFKHSVGYLSASAKAFYYWIRLILLNGSPSAHEWKKRFSSRRTETTVKNYLLTCGHHSIPLVNNVSDWWSTFVFVETDLLLINFWASYFEKQWGLHASLMRVSDLETLSPVKFELTLFDKICDWSCPMNWTFLLYEETVKLSANNFRKSVHQQIESVWRPRSIWCV